MVIVLDLPHKFTYLSLFVLQMYLFKVNSLTILIVLTAELKIDIMTSLTLFLHFYFSPSTLSVIGSKVSSTQFLLTLASERYTIYFDIGINPGHACI